MAKMFRWIRKQCVKICSCLQSGEADLEDDHDVDESTAWDEIIAQQENAEQAPSAEGCKSGGDAQNLQHTQMSSDFDNFSKAPEYKETGEQVFGPDELANIAEFKDEKVGTIDSKTGDSSSVGDSSSESPDFEEIERQSCGPEDGASSAELQDEKDATSDPTTCSVPESVTEESQQQIVLKADCEFKNKSSEEDTDAVLEESKEQENVEVSGIEELPVEEQQIVLKADCESKNKSFDEDTDAGLEESKGQENAEVVPQTQENASVSVDEPIASHQQESVFLEEDSEPDHESCSSSSASGATSGESELDFVDNFLAEDTDAVLEERKVEEKIEVGVPTTTENTLEQVDEPIVQNSDQVDDDSESDNESCNFSSDAETTSRSRRDDVDIRDTFQAEDVKSLCSNKKFQLRKTVDLETGERVQKIHSDALIVLNKDHEFYVHQEILRGYSQFFDERFSGKDKAYYTLHFQSDDVNPDVLSSILDVLYAKRFPPQDLMPEVLRTAKFLKMDGFLNKVEEVKETTKDMEAESSSSAFSESSSEASDTTDSETEDMATQTPRKTHVSKFLEEFWDE